MTDRDARAAAELAGQLGYPSNEAQIRRRFESVSGDTSSAVFVAEDEEGRVIGWTHVVARASLEMDPCAELAGLVVDRTARRLGAGRALLSAAESWASERGYRTMRVRSNVKRIEARPFYEGRGYVIGKTQHVYEKALE
jgi:GNAT superfamily N-acetyltransferase